MKKMLAILLAVSMIMGLAISASADTATLDCTGWWTAHTDGVEVTTDGVTVTFDSTTYESATANWNGPIYILYSGDEAKVNGAGYTEYWVHRLDNYGWAGEWASWKNTNEHVADLNALGVTLSSVCADGCWDNFLANLQAGISVTVNAKLVDGNAVVQMIGNGVDYTVSVPVDTSKPVYLSLSGEMCTLSNIVATSNKVEEPTTEPETAAPEYKEVTAPETGIAFKLATVQENLETTLYFAGTTANQDYYLATTEVVTEATDVYLEAVEGGYRMYFDAEGVKTYIDIYENGTYINLRLTTEPTAVYTWNTEYNTLVAVIGETEYYMGTYKTYNTLSASKLSYISTSFPCKLYQEVKVVADGSNAKTGDSISVFVALMAVSAMGIAIVSKKRF